MIRPLVNAALTLAIVIGVASTVSARQDERRLVSGYAVTLRLPPDGLVPGEEVEIEFRLEDVRDGQEPRPVQFARLRAVVDMPAMPAMPPFDELAHSEGVPGEYGFHPTFATAASTG